MSKQRIISLQGLRSFAFIAVFMSHSISGMGLLGAWGVSVFFVLSGFVCAYSSSLDENILSSYKLKDAFIFSVNKIKKLYPLHLITFSYQFFFLLKSLIDQEEPLAKYIKMGIKSLLNVFLLQSWIPINSIYFSFNAVSWYLSASIFHYFLFPFIFNIFNKLKSVRDYLFIGIIVIGLQIYVSLILTFTSSAVTSDFCLSIHWITYISPFARSGDFILGVTCYFIYKSVSINNVCTMVLSFLAWLIVFVSNCLAISGAVPEGFLYTTIFSVSSSLLVYTVALSCGFLSKIYNNKILVKIGNLSGYAFLIHTIIISIVRALMEKIHISSNSIMLFLCSLCITLLLTKFWIYLQTVLLQSLRRGCHVE